MGKSTRDPFGSKRAMQISPVQDDEPSPITDEATTEIGDTGAASAEDSLMSQLRELYNSVADEPIPESLQTLLKRFKN